MAVRCQHCGHLNDNVESERFCEVCHTVLPAGEEGAAPVQTDSSADRRPVGTPSEPAPPTAQRPVKRRSRYPQCHPLPPSPIVAQPSQRQVHSRSGSVRPQVPSRRTDAPATPVARPDRSRSRDPAHRGTVLEGTIIRVDPLEAEPRDVDVARVLFSLILTIDLVLVLGPLVLILVAVLIGLAILAAVFRMVWLITVFGFLLQSIFFFISPIVTALVGRRDNRQLEPVTNYLIRTEAGEVYTFRVKGQLRGASTAQGDRVRVWGHPQHGILSLRGGERLDTREPLSLPFNWSWLLLVCVIIANIVAYVVLRGGP